MGWPQQMSWPWPGLVTMNSEPHLVQKYRFPTWFAMVCHPNRVYRCPAYGVNIGRVGHSTASRRTDLSENSFILVLKGA